MSASVDVSQVQELVDDTAYPVMFEKYEEKALVYPLLGKVITPEEASTPNYGHKGAVISGFEDFKDREDGAPVESGTFDSAYTWYAKIRQKSRKMSLAGRLFKSVQGRQKAGTMIGEWASKMGTNARLHKENHVADMFQKGTLTAGSRDFFDGSHPGNTDPYPLVGYDGEPWFDAAHPLSHSSTTLSNIDSGSTALTQANVQAKAVIMKTTNAVDERGNRVSITPDTIMVPGGLEYTASTVLNSTQVSGSANNDINPIRGQFNLIVNNALDDVASASAWWMLQLGEGLIIIDSGAPAITVEYEQATDTFHFYAGFEFGAAMTNWRYAYCSNKAIS